MKLNILVYGSTENPQNIPSAWPAQVKAVADNAPAPTAPWQEMTLDVYASYLAAHQSEYDAWAASREAARNTALATLANQYDAAITAMVNFGNIANPTTSQAVQAVQTHNSVLLKLLPILRGMYLSNQ